jgi:cellulose synthase/poly-beta-1,6-N-acetylglucosamine synthase-like glycosyltransferase
MGPQAGDAKWRAQSQHHRSGAQRGRSIRETLAQLLALDYSNYEIIAVNDRSTDRTGLIMDEVGRKFPGQKHGS